MNNNNNFHFLKESSHVPKADFRTLSFRDTIVQGHRECSLSVYLRLYISAVLLVVEYGALVWVAAVTEGCNQRKPC